MPLPSGLTANRSEGAVIPAEKENADTEAINALLGLLGGAGLTLKIPYLVLQAAAAYPTRPALTDFPVAWWIGSADPTGFSTFAARNATTGAGDIWVQVPA